MAGQFFEDAPGASAEGRIRQMRQIMKLAHDLREFRKDGFIRSGGRYYDIIYLRDQSGSV
jgi:hypothetical protein